MNSVILYRRKIAGAIEDKEEIEAIDSIGLPRIHQRSNLKYFAGDTKIVVPRYYLWPFASEVILDIELMGCRAINDIRSSLWIRDCGEWSSSLHGLTPDTWNWNAYTSMLRDPGPVVLKGAEKSCGHKWLTHMYAKDRSSAVANYMRLMEDSMFSEEDIYVRRYEPLKRLQIQDENIFPNRPPCSEEYRFFVLDGKVICSGFYWSSYVDEMVNLPPHPSEVPIEFLQSVINRVRNDAPCLRLWVMDVARKVDGGWIVVELNDGCSSGLSNIDPKEYYAAISNL